MRYSKEPLQEHFLQGLDQCAFRLISTLPNATAVWNAYWCFDPEVDKLPALGSAWMKHYQHPEGLLAAVIRDLSNRQVAIAFKLHPVLLMELSGVAVMCSETNKVLGSARVERQIFVRARQAADRCLTEQPAVRVQSGRLCLVEAA